MPSLLYVNLMFNKHSVRILIHALPPVFHYLTRGLHFLNTLRCLWNIRMVRLSGQDRSKDGWVKDDDHLRSRSHRTP